MLETGMGIGKENNGLSVCRTFSCAVKKPAFNIRRWWI
jgi:hypothetical protein